MEKWEKMMYHRRASMDCWAESLGEKKPVHPKGGVTLVKFRRFDGKLFWPLFEKSGHTSMEYDKCICHKND